jgi:hypothetical protein
LASGGGIRSESDATGAVDVEDAVEATVRQPRAHADAEIDELVVGERRVQAGPQVVVHVGVVERVPLGELGGQALSFAEPVPRSVADLVVEGLVDRVGLGPTCGHVACRPPVEAEVAVVDLRDPQPRGFELTQRQRRLRVHRIRQRRRRGGERRGQARPHVDGGV